MVIMKITLRLYATLTKFLGDHSSGTPVEMEIPAGSTLQSLVILLKLPPEEVKITFVNGIICELDKQLQDGDEVGIFPPIGGG